jgi:hypothetical protein
MLRVTLAWLHRLRLYPLVILGLGDVRQLPSHSAMLTYSAYYALLLAPALYQLYDQLRLVAIMR